MAGERRSPEVTWWETWPDLYETELAAFAAHRASATVAYKANGLLILDVNWPDGDKKLKLRVGYSPLHPFFRPSVEAPDLTLQRHQHPVERTLCLITQGSGEWYSAQAVADFIGEQLAGVLAANAAREEGRLADAAQLEENAPDPLAPYYAHLASGDSVIFFPAESIAPKGTAGFAHFEVGPRAVAPGAIEGVLRKVTPATGKWFGKSFDLPLSDGPAESLEGRWVRMAPPASQKVEEILAAAEAAIANSTLLQPAVAGRLREVGCAARTITGIVFKEELAYGPDGQGDGWLFIVSSNDPNTGRRLNRMVRGVRLDKDLRVRVPVATELASKRVLLVGVGAIGSFVAAELARAGVGRLRIIDSDVVEPGNAVRWPLGRPAWGARKVAALKHFLERNYPEVTIDGFHMRVGATTTQVPTAGDTYNHLAELQELISEADVVIDASAQTECQEALAYFCRRLGKAFVLGYATEGAAGGVVARFPANCDACYVCFREHWNDPGFPRPAVDAAGTVVPIGCNQPTFTGASFDLQEVSLELTRSAVGLLAPGAYKRGHWDVAMLSLRKDANRVLPTWEPASLSPKCPECSRE